MQCVLRLVKILTRNITAVKEIKTAVIFDLRELHVSPRSRNLSLRLGEDLPRRYLPRPGPAISGPDGPVKQGVAARHFAEPTEIGLRTLPAGGGRACRQIGVCLRHVALAFGGFELGLGLLKFDLQIGRVELDEQIALMHRLVVVDVYFFDVCRDLGTDLRYVGFNECVIGRLELLRVKPVGNTQYGGYQQQAAANEQYLFAFSLFFVDRFNYCRVDVAVFEAAADALGQISI